MTGFCASKTQQLLKLSLSISPAASVCWRAATTRLWSSSSSSSGEDASGSSMLRHLTSKITATGPISVAEYMREALTNPVMGYYVKKNMLGADGDFITSPEISQIFGELLGVWVVSEWMAAGRPKQLQLVELGPGKGSLTSDILRVQRHRRAFFPPTKKSSSRLLRFLSQVFAQLQPVLSSASVSLHLVEVSPVLSRLQAQNLVGTSDSVEVERENEPVYRQGRTAAGLPVSWYRRLEDVPPGFSIFLAHEFFDALPIHKFQRTKRGWREVMVDVDPDRPGRLRFVVAPSPTLASTTLVQSNESRDHVEVCAEGGVIIQQLARRVAQHGGAALIADYGHDGTKTDTFRGFKGHHLHDVLTSPGCADLTADVDFGYVRRMAGTGVACLGPVAQRTFLKNMGIDVRMQVLLRNSNQSDREQLLRSYETLTDGAKMGERFLFFGLLHPSRLARPKMATGLKLEKKEPAQPPVGGFTEIRFA